MKCLTVTVDDRTLFSGEVAEIQWGETAETVTVSARFAPSPSLMQSLQQLAQKGQQQAPPPESNDSPQRRLDVVREVPDDEG